MGNLDFVNNAIASRFKDLHTAYLAKVISANGNSATIQPLGLIKEYGTTAKKQAIVSNVPIATHKVGTTRFTYVSGVSLEKEMEGETLKDVTLNTTTNTQEILVIEPITAGDIVVCVVCDRDITDAKNGINSLPAIGEHSLSNSVIVGVL